MPKLAESISAYQLRRLTKPGLHAVGGVTGLYLRIKESGARSWALRIVIGKRRREVGLGGYPTVSLEKAREYARFARDQVRRGIDPIAARRETRDALHAADAMRITFKQAAQKFLKAKTSEFKNKKHAAQWGATLETYAFPTIGALPVDQIELAHVVSVVEPIWKTKTETASRLRGRIEAVLSYATVCGYRKGDNPARWRGNLSHVLPKPSRIKKVRHFQALPWQDMGEFMAALRDRDGISAKALEFAILTAARSGEVRLATWGEINLDGKQWTVPGERMKSGKAHSVPLSPPVITLIKSLPHHVGCNYVFASPRGGALSDMTLSAVTRRMGVDAVPHGFRSTFKDWARCSTNYADEVSELALAHVSSDSTRAAYARDQLLPKRARLMRDWARHCATVTTARE